MSLTVSGVIFDEVSCNIFCYAVDVRYFVPETNAVELVRVLKQFRSEGGRDELCIFAELMDHVGDCFTMLSIKSLNRKCHLIKNSIEPGNGHKIWI